MPILLVIVVLALLGLAYFLSKIFFRKEKDEDMKFIKGAVLLAILIVAGSGIGWYIYSQNEKEKEGIKECKGLVINIENTKLVGKWQFTKGIYLFEEDGTFILTDLDGNTNKGNWRTEGSLIFIKFSGTDINDVLKVCYHDNKELIFRDKAEEHQYTALKI